MSKLIDITGQRFNDWQVIDRAPNDKRGRSRWNCQCLLCGAIKEVDGNHLRRGDTKNCGCLRNKQTKERNMKHEEGKIYGFLQVIREATPEERPRKDRYGVYWNCTCLKCGRENFIVLGDYLRNGDTSSCGCLLSKNESIIAVMLDKANIKYKQQHRFSDLTSTGRECDQLLFDFAIFDENDNLLYLIEYDGIQHFNKKHSWKENGFEITRNNDLLKNKYCFDNNILIIRIPYNEQYNLNDLKLETSRFILTPENESEYYNKT